MASRVNCRVTINHFVWNGQRFWAFVKPRGSSLLEFDDVAVSASAAGHAALGIAGNERWSDLFAAAGETDVPLSLRKPARAALFALRLMDILALWTAVAAVPLRRRLGLVVNVLCPRCGRTRPQRYGVFIRFGCCGALLGNDFAK